MDRNIVYAGSIPLDTDILSINRNAMLAIGSVLRLLVGPGTCVDGLECTPTNPPSMSVSVAPGSVTQLSVIDVAPYGSLAADTSTPIMKMGINSEKTDFNFQAPNIPGQSVNYLIQASLQETDTNDIVLPYYNAADPSLSYSGPGNSGVAQSTLRRQLVNLQVKPGVPAPTGTQTTPSPDEGAVGLYSVSVASGQIAINTTSILTLPTAPFLYWKAPQLRPGFGSGVRSFTSSGSFVVPHGVTQVEVELWGGGSGSFASVAGLPSGGGAGGGYAKRLISGLTPGQALDVVVGAGGAAGTVSGTAPGNGGTSSISNIVSATGGRLNYLATANAPPKWSHSARNWRQW